MFTFKGGIYPPQNKEMTAEKRIEIAPIPDKVVISLAQHTGEYSRPIVNIKDSVKTGQKIAEAVGKASLPVHSSISGRVAAICPWPDSSGTETMSIVIESDGKDELAQGVNVNREYLCFSSEDIRSVLRDAGVSGLGGKSFPAHVKFNPPANVEIDTIVLNGCESEPFLTGDQRLMIEYAHDIIQGLKIIMRLVDADKAIVAIESSKQEAIARMKQEIKREPNIWLSVVKAKYPQGNEKHLIDAVLGRKIYPGKLPFDVGVVLSNAGTALAIRNAVIKNKPLYERVITVTGHGIKEQKNLMVRIGAQFKDIIKICGGFSGETRKVISGGPMMGIAQYSLEVPVVKGTTGILVLNDTDEQAFSEPEYGEVSCIRCGKCIDSCPRRLIPSAIYINARHQKWEILRKYNVHECMECGACAYGCPAKLNIIQSIKVAKKMLNK